MNVYKLKPGVESLDSLIAGSSDLSSVCRLSLLYAVFSASKSNPWLRRPSAPMERDRGSSQRHYTPYLIFQEAPCYPSRTRKPPSISRNRRGRASRPRSASPRLPSTLPGRRSLSCLGSMSSELFLLITWVVFRRLTLRPSSFGASTAEANTTYISLASCLQHSLSRGSVVSPPSALQFPH